MSIEKWQAQMISEKVWEAVKPILEEAGLDPEHPRTTYGSKYVFKVEASEVDIDERGINRKSSYAQDFLAYPPRYDLPAEALGVTFVCKGREFIFIGTNNRARRRPIVARNKDDGREYAFDRNAIPLIKAGVANAGLAGLL